MLLTYIYSLPRFPTRGQRERRAGGQSLPGAGDKEKLKWGHFCQEGGGRGNINLSKYGK